jgi:hypothetical protein
VIQALRIYPNSGFPRVDCALLREHLILECIGLLGGVSILVRQAGSQIKSSSHWRTSMTG